MEETPDLDAFFSQLAAEPPLDVSRDALSRSWLLAPQLWARQQGDRTQVVGPGTFPLRDQLRTLGFRWDPAAEAWWAPEEAFDRLWAQVEVPAEALKPTALASDKQVQYAVRLTRQAGQPLSESVLASMSAAQVSDLISRLT